MADPGIPQIDTNILDSNCASNLRRPHNASPLYHLLRSLAQGLRHAREMVSPVKLIKAR
jgi:hypothetical protein